MSSFLLRLSCLVLLAVAVVVTPLASAKTPEIESPLTFPSDFDRANLEAMLQPDHPRLFASAARWAEIQRSLETSVHMQNLLAALKIAAEEIEEVSPEERVMTGRRLLGVSREVLRRTLVLSSLYRLTGEEKYFERARAEMLSAAAFEDWNPGHFLDTAEMTLALATGYDWLYPRLSKEDRTTIRRAIVVKGLRPGMGKHSWKKGDNNWNQVCFAGMVAGALAIGEHEPDLAVEFLRETFANNPLALDAYRPHGGYPEGPRYWIYGTHFQVILLSVLQSALGETWGLERYPAFQESAIYINQMIGPSGEFYNYGDGASGVFLMPALHWFANEAENSALDAHNRNILEGPVTEIAERARSERLFPLALLWLNPDLEKKEAEPLPLHWRADGPNPVAVHRSSWNEDAFFVGLKGGSPSVNHGHMDIGSFVLDWRGLRWATDLGAQDYESLESIGMRIWARGQDADRWRVFRLNTFSHNTLVVNGQPQRADAFAPIVAFSADQDDPFTVVDMSAVYEGALTRAMRGVRLLDEDRVLLQDEVAGLEEGAELRWGMVTRAEVERKGNIAVLRQKDEVLFATIVSPKTSEFEVLPTDPGPNEFDAANPGTRMLAFFVEAGESRLPIRVVFSAQPLSEAEKEQIALQSLPE